MDAKKETDKQPSICFWRRLQIEEEDYAVVVVVVVSVVFT